MKRKIQDCLAYRLFLLLPLFSFGGCVEIKAPVDYVNPVIVFTTDYYSIFYR